MLHGGGQERDVRSGTLDTPAIAGLRGGRRGRRQAPARTRRAPRRRCATTWYAGSPPPSRTRSSTATPTCRSRIGCPGNAHFSFPGCEGDALLLLLDARGIECSTGSACSAGVPQPSHVLLAMGIPEDLARGSLRFSFGHTSTPADVDAVADAIGPVVERARRAGQNGVRARER